MSHFSEPTIAISRRGNLTSKPRNTTPSDSTSPHFPPATSSLPVPDWSSMLTLPSSMDDDFGGYHHRRFSAPELGYLGMYNAPPYDSTTSTSSNSQSTNMKSQQWTWVPQQYTGTVGNSGSTGISGEFHPEPLHGFRHQHSSASHKAAQGLEPPDHRPRSLLVQHQQSETGWSNSRSEQASPLPPSSHNLVLRIQNNEDIITPSGPSPLPSSAHSSSSTSSTANWLDPESMIPMRRNIKIQPSPTPTLGAHGSATTTSSSDYSSFPLSMSSPAQGVSGWRAGSGTTATESFVRQLSSGSQASSSSPSSSNRDLQDLIVTNRRVTPAHPNISVPTPTASLSSSWDPNYFDGFRYSLSSPWTPTSAASATTAHTPSSSSASHYNHHSHSRHHHNNTLADSLINTAHLSVNHSPSNSVSTVLHPTEQLSASTGGANDGSSVSSFGYNISLNGNPGTPTTSSNTTPSPPTFPLTLSSPISGVIGYPNHRSPAHSRSSQLRLNDNAHTKAPTRSPYTRPRSAESVRSDAAKKECSHCKATSTPLWRREPTTLKPLCNACGLYLQQRHKWRPQELIDADAEELIDDDTTNCQAGDGTGSNVGHGGPTCSHCSARYTSVWRRSPDGAQLCNACGVYLRLRGVPRPLTLRRRKPKPRSRHSNTSTGNANPLANVSVSVANTSLTPKGLMQGIPTAPMTPMTRIK